MNLHELAMTRKESIIETTMNEYVDLDYNV